ncbi:alpha/beta fold hydrolase [Mycolicibacterium litorale]|uniref:alpha/beta fold hydrolase n=1 Tax=Mycolicibacterium litorale TaxID=758802 RepID=UPI003CF1F022
MSDRLDTLLRPLTGTHEEVIRSDGARLNVLVAGDGPTVLLVHGYGASVSEWSVVQPQLLQSGYRVLAYDHRGHGRSTIGRQGLTASALFSDLEAVINHYQVENTILVGHSMGTFTCLGALARGRINQRVDHLVLISTETGDIYRGSPGAKFMAPIVRSRAAAALIRQEPIGRYLAKRLTGPAPDDAVFEMTRRLLVEMPRDVGPLLDVMAAYSVEPGLPDIAPLPVTMLWGTHDRISPRWHTDVVARALNARLEILQGVGHMVNWEAPQAIFQAIVSATALAKEQP